MRKNVLFAALAAAVALAASLRAEAYIDFIPESLAHDVLSESTPTAFAPNDFGAGDFEVRWAGKPIDGVTLRLVPVSLEWVRVAELLVLPRAKLEVAASGVESGTVLNSGYSQGFAMSGGNGTAVLPVALLSGARNPITITVVRGGREIQGVAEIRFKPRSGTTKTRVFFDSSCSPFGVHVSQDTIAGANSEWAYIGCRLVVEKSARWHSGSLEMLVYWDGAPAEITVDRATTPSLRPSVWALRLRKKPGHLELASDAGRIALSYFAPDPFHYLYVGGGLGPYSYTFLSSTDDVNSFTGLVTLYGSYFITESTRLVAFDATTIHRRFYTDFGIYLSNESFNLLDRRLSLNLLLGAHAIAFYADGQYLVRFGGPQGIELDVRDAGIRGYNASFGAFIYPLISHKSYYNVWLRYGTRGYFGEFNYIAWHERAISTDVYSRSFGVSFGMPLGLFF